MNQISEFIRERVLWFVVAISLSAGLIGAYGRERNDGRSPDAGWWLTRAYIMPFFAIVAAWAAEQFHLNSQQSALVASLLALMGYEAVRWVIDYLRAKKEQMMPRPPAATAKPYASMIDTDRDGRPAAHIVFTPSDDSTAGIVGDSLRGVYGAHPTPIGADLTRLVDKLEDEPDK